MQHGDSNVKVRLDRFLMNPTMMSWKSASVVKHVLSPKSHHCMLAVNLKRVAEPTEGHKRRFMLENVAEIQNFPTSHQDLSMERLAMRERGVHLHTLVDR